MLNTTTPEKLQENSERITRLFERYIERFSSQDLQPLADRWRKILYNYKRAVELKIRRE